MTERESRVAACGDRTNLCLHYGAAVNQIDLRAILATSNACSVREGCR